MRHAVKARRVLAIAYLLSGFAAAQNLRTRSHSTMDDTRAWVRGEIDGEEQRGQGTGARHGRCGGKARVIIGD